jgi:hypothetical protein
VSEPTPDLVPCQWRQAGARRQWVVLGPASIVQPDTTVVVQESAGTRRGVYVADVGQEFEHDGVQMRYGYPLASSPNTDPRTREILAIMIGAAADAGVKPIEIAAALDTSVARVNRVLDARTSPGCATNGR